MPIDEFETLKFFNFGDALLFQFFVIIVGDSAMEVGNLKVGGRSFPLFFGVDVKVETA